MEIDKNIELKKNDQFSQLKGLDLQELLFKIQNFDLIYRKKLQLPSNVTFGIELEYEDVKKENVDNYVQENLNLWISKKDASIAIGGEINSPILYDELTSWEELQKICNFLKKKNANTSKNAGGHIHIGSHILGDNVDNWKMFLKTYAAYESVLFRFLFGDKITGRKRILDFAKPITDDLYDKIYWINHARSLFQLYEDLPKERRQALNFVNTDFENVKNKRFKNTLEFRSPNATIEEVIWQNNINALTKLILAPIKGLIDQEFLDYKLEHERISSKKEYYLYSLINLKNALELVDLIFDNNLDKLYFLRQYLKNFEENYTANEAINAKIFF